MQQLKTDGFNGSAVEFSPFYADQLAVATGANFGIIGNGRLFILANGTMKKWYDTQDGMLDVAWSECHEKQLVVGCGDGSIKLFDVTVDTFPIMDFREHQREVYSVNWNPISKSTFLSASWDLTIKLWDPTRNVSLSTWAEHSHCIYQAIFSPHSPEQFISASGDHTVKLWDTRQPNSTVTFRAHQQEVLTLDFNKYNREQIVTGSVDSTIKTWDLRQTSGPLSELKVHDYAVRRLKCSPFERDLVASVSYDMTMKLTNLQTRQQVLVFDMHTEFVMGVDFSLFQRGLIATCAWDEAVYIIPT